MIIGETGITSEMILNEGKISEKEIIEKFGTVLFGSYKGFEPDTPYEKKVFGNLKSYYDNYKDGNQKITPDMVRMFKELLDIKNDYNDPEFNDILDPFYHEKHKYLYRGVHLPPDKAFKSADVEIDFSKLKYKIAIEPGDNNKVPVYDVTKYSSLSKYKPKQTVESWTTKIETGYYYGLQHGNASKITKSQILLEIESPYKIRDQLLFEPDFLDASVGFRMFHVLRVSDKPIKIKVYMIDELLYEYMEYSTDPLTVFTPRELADPYQREVIFFSEADWTRHE